MVFAACTLYYTHAYIAEQPVQSGNKRAEWYRNNRSFVRASQVLMTCIVAACIFLLLYRSGSHIIQATVWQWLVTAIFPVTGALYYGSVAPGKSTHNLRNNGWLKPFVIGFVWAGTVTVYPVLFKSIESGEPYNPGLFNLLLFIKNLMYITMLCIMFDFKDYAADHNQQLKTFVVRIGLRKTLFFVIIPLTIIGLGTFLSFAFFSHFPPGRIAVNTIPFILLIFVTLSMQRRKSILYYLAIIDGLMLVKALCGITGMLLW